MYLEKKITAFVHIEKTAGTSVIHMLRNRLFPFYLDVRPVTANGYWFRPSDLDWYLKLFPATKIIGGHSVVPYAGLENSYSVKYFTVFREPVARYVSQFRYWRSNLGVDISFEKFLEKGSTHNFQTKKIVSSGQAGNAIPVLEDKFVTIGVLENIDPFIRELSNHFNKDLAMFSRNVTANKQDQVDDLMSRYHQQIMDRNEEDLRLHEWAQKRQKSGPPCARRKGHSIRAYMDFILRKAAVEPLSGLKRRGIGLPSKGSYGIDSRG